MVFIDHVNRRTRGLAASSAIVGLKIYNLFIIESLAVHSRLSDICTLFSLANFCYDLLM